MKDNLKSMFSPENIGLTILFVILIGALIYLMVTSFSLGALIAVCIAGYAGYVWGYLRGKNAQKREDEKQR